MASLGNYGVTNRYHFYIDNRTGENLDFTYFVGIGVTNGNGTIESQHVMVDSMVGEEDEQHHIIKGLPQKQDEKQYEEAAKRILLPGINEFQIDVTLSISDGGPSNKVVIKRK